MSNSKVLVFGISIMDIFGFVDNKYHSHDSLPGCVHSTYGGVCRNIAENLVHIGVDTKFISALGDDPAGLNMLNHARQIGLDMEDSLILENATTPTYMAILDENREMVSAIVDMKITHHLTTEFIDSKKEHILASDYMIIDCDMPDLVEYIVKNFANDTKLILDPVSTTKVLAIKELIPYFNTIKPNRHEAAALVGFPLNSEENIRKAGKIFLDQGIKNVFISLDKDGVYYCNKKEEGLIKAGKCSVLNVTGAGDAFVAGLAYGFINLTSTIDIVKFAITMSSAAIASECTIHPDLNLPFIERLLADQSWEVSVYR